MLKVRIRGPLLDTTYDLLKSKHYDVIYTDATEKCHAYVTIRCQELKYFTRLIKTITMICLRNNLEVYYIEQDGIVTCDLSRNFREVTV